jgi:hypothetical protein
VLLGIARLPLATEPTHADRSAGLSFLGGPTRALAAFAFGASAVAAAAWSSDIALTHARATQFTGPLVALVCVMLLLALAPLAAFAGHLRRSRARGLAELGRLGLIYSRRFRVRWSDREPAPEFLGTEDIQSLSDLAQCFRAVRRMRLIPCGKYELALLLIALVAPVAPLVTTEIPLPALIAKVLHSVLG